jgi:pantoate--beta-alanine ligase
MSAVELFDATGSTRPADKPLWLTAPEAVRAAVRRARRADCRVGLVPTMGGLHDGHRSLLRRARAETDLVVATIFVNPLQFGPTEDLCNYPRTPDEDRQLCAQESVDIVFEPDVEAMYPAGHCTRVEVTGLEDSLCGRSRPGHFVGVATVVAKLFNLIPANVAYFGEKDYQQTRIIQRMVADLNFDVEIRVHPTVREPDGLAMSSRNRYLSPRERQEATALYRALQLAGTLVANGERDPALVRKQIIDFVSTQTSATIDYVELVDPDSLQPVTTLERRAVAAVAAWFGKARLIDNATISP